MLKDPGPSLCATRTGEAESVPALAGMDSPGADSHCTLQNPCYQKAWKCLHIFVSDNSREAVVGTSLCSQGVCRVVT